MRNMMLNIPVLMSCRVICLLVLLAGWFSPVSAAETTVFQGGTILTATGEEFSPGTLVVSEGKIVAVGPADEITVPDEATVHDVSGKVIIPGLVDTHSHLGVYSRPMVNPNADGNESTAPVQSIVRALDSINPFDPGIRMARAGGITTANIMPGSANVIGGQTLYVKLRGHTPERMWLGPEEVLGGLKMANGENPKRSYGSRNQAPGTRMKVAALQRAEFIKAQAYQRKWEEYRQKKEDGDEEATPPDVDLSLEPLVEVLTGKRTVHFHTHRADDIITVLRLKEEFGFDLVIQHGTEAYKVIDRIAEAGVPVSMTIVDSPGGKAEVVHFIEECGAELTQAGVKVLINTDDPITESRLFLRTAATAHRGGMTEEETLRAITIHGAEALRLDHRIGSLEPGKDADFVILSGRPFSVYTRVLQTYIDGVQEFDLEDERDHRYQTGGFAVNVERRPPIIDTLVTADPIPAVPADSSLRTSFSRVQNDETDDSLQEADEFVVLAKRVYPVSGEPIDDGMVHVKGGRIVAVGPRGEGDLPENVPVISAVAVTPGLVDAHSVVPLAGEYNIPADQDADEKSDPNQADLRAIDGFHPSEPLLRFLLENGITVVHACPGRANVVAGQSGVFRTHGRTADEMVIRFPQTMVFNLGESPKGTYSGAPGTRMGTASLIRKTLNEAASYERKRIEAEEADEPKPFDRDLKKEHLASVLRGETAAMFCAQRGDDLLTALRLAEEFELKPVLALAAEGYLLADRIKEADVPVIVHPTMQRLTGLEAYNSSFSNAAVLANAEIPVAISSGFEAYVPKSRVIRHEAALAMVYGLGHERALHAVTLGAARILGIEEEYGSLEEGKVADLVLYNGDPFEHVTHVVGVIVDGKLVYSRSDRPEIPLAERLFHSVPEVPCCSWW
jgi:imidazolonepropionase-like amidohydrolase